jgi:hypothetical protein
MKDSPQRSKIGKESQDLRMHLARTIHPGFKEVSYDPNADETR